MNFHRRHLTDQQRTMVAARSLDYYSKLAKERQVEAGKNHGRGQEKVVANSPPPKKAKARDEAGALLGVSGRSVERAAHVEAVRDDAKERKKEGNAKGGKSVQSSEPTKKDNSNLTDAHRAKLAGTNRQYKTGRLSFSRRWARMMESKLIAVWNSMSNLVWKSERIAARVSESGDGPGWVHTHLTTLRSDALSFAPTLGAERLPLWLPPPTRSWAWSARSASPVRCCSKHKRHSKPVTLPKPV